MSNHDRHGALVRDIGRRLAMCSLDEVRVVDEALLEIERDRHGVPGKSDAFAAFMRKYLAGVT